jgi:hypothetical protein
MRKARIHGEARHKKRTPEWIIWWGMISRCKYPTHVSYKYYGANGIVVCRRWTGRDGYKNFLKDMGRRPTPDHTIDRINSKKNYTPSNVRWIHKNKQNSNKKNTLMVEFNGEVRTLVEWSKITGIPWPRLRYRLFYAKWPVNKAFTT